MFHLKYLFIIPEKLHKGRGWLSTIIIIIYWLSPKAGTPAVVKHDTKSNENHSQSIAQCMVTARQYLASTLLTGPVGVVGVCRSLLCCGRCIIGNSKAGEGRGGGMTGVMTSSGSLVTCDTNAWKGMTVHNSHLLSISGHSFSYPPNRMSYWSSDFGLTAGLELFQTALCFQFWLTH